MRSFSSAPGTAMAEPGHVRLFDLPLERVWPSPARMKKALAGQLAPEADDD
jgi:hypothetical protein